MDLNLHSQMDLEWVKVLEAQVLLSLGQQDLDSVVVELDAAVVASLFLAEERD